MKTKLCCTIALTLLLCIFLQGCDSNIETPEPLLLHPAYLSFCSEEGSLDVLVSGPPVAWSAAVMEGASWCSILQKGSILKISLTKNPDTYQRVAIIRLNVEEGNFSLITVTQAGAGQVIDGWCTQYLAKTKGKGVDVVLMGDGFTHEEIANGKYAAAMKDAMNALFDIQPYKAYRAYFNVYVVDAVSPNSGISDLSKSQETKFKTQYAQSGSSTGMSTDTDLCFSFALKAPVRDINKTLIILVANASRYGGTCFFWTSGKAIAICPMSVANYPYGFKSVVQHEAGGHGFAKLADEYVNASVAEGRSKNDITSWHKSGCFQNVDVTGDPAKVIWKDFIGASGYSMVGTWEGAYYFSTGVWRSEECSCMINNIGYYNAPSRAAIVKRIMDLAGESYSIASFMIADIIEPAPKTKSGTIPYMPPLAPPVIFVGED